jgi:endonuclease G
MVDIQTFGEVERVVRERLKKTRPEIDTSLARIAEGNPLAAEPERRRRVERLQVKADLTREQAEMISTAIEAVAEPAKTGRKPAIAAAKPMGPEAIQGSTLDFVGVAFLERGRRAADAVGRVAFLNEMPQGSGFLVGPNLFLTNHHVIQTAADAARFQVQFDYERDKFNELRQPTSFLLDPELCFVTDGIDGLDYTLIGIGPRRRGQRALDEFGFLVLSNAGDKHMLGEIANVVQHPDGRHKELVLRENHLVARDETLHVLHYVADTEQGSSGSPVFNNEWEPIALHHWGGPWHEVMGTDGKPLAKEINEGIRISAIVDDLETRLAGMDGRSRAAATQLLDIWEEAGRLKLQPVPEGAIETNKTDARAGKAQALTSGGDGAPKARLGDDGSVTWTFPIEISVRAPLAAAALTAHAPKAGEVKTTSPGAEAASWKTENFDDRGGYEPGFVPGFVLPLPKHDGAPGRPAKNLLAKPGDDPFELRYHHVSIVMNAERRLAYYTACNIDGSRIKAVNRDDKTVTDDPSLSELGIESMGEMGAEASDDFRPDRRVLLEEQMNKPFYDAQKVAGFPIATSNERKARIFQKGHITLRGDPAWGTDAEAVAAERDTFFYTNAAPQLGFFNQGSALNRPGSKGKLRWRAVETYVLRNAVTMRSRVTVFAGPVFADSDPPYRFESKVPLKFWKIAAWSDGTELRSIALLADQGPLIEVMPEGMAEAFGDAEELARVSEFLTTVAHIESLTGLNFGDTLRDADVRAGQEAIGKPALTLEPKDLARHAARKPAAKPARTGSARKASKPGRRRK